MTITVSSGAFREDLVVSSGQTLSILSGGEVEDLTVYSGGLAEGAGAVFGTIYVSGAVSGLSFGLRESEFSFSEVASGGSITSATLAYGEITVDSGGRRRRP